MRALPILILLLCGSTAMAAGVDGIENPAQIDGIATPDKMNGISGLAASAPSQTWEVKWADGNAVISDSELRWADGGIYAYKD